MNTLTPDELGAIFSGALIEVVSKISSLSIAVLSKAQDAEFCEIVSVMSLNSGKGGMLFLSADESDLRVLCSYITGDRKDDVTADDMHDALCELLNMTAGNAKVRLQSTERMFKLSSPFVIGGSAMSIISKKRSTVISRHLGNGDISIKLKVVY